MKTFQEFESLNLFVISAKDPYGVQMRCACYLCLLLSDKQPLM